MANSFHPSNSSAGSSPGGSIDFPSTHWTSILAGKEGDWDAVQDALGKLCARYRPAILDYFRLKWRWYQPWAQVQDAEDLTQSFIVHLLEAGRLQALDPRKVRRFRFYLMTALRNFLQDWVATQIAQKRGNGQQPLSIDQPGTPERIDLPAEEPELALALSRSLAVTVHHRVMEQLRREVSDPTRFGRLRHFIVIQPELGDYSAAAMDLGISQDVVKTTVSRLLRRYAALFLQESSLLVANGPDDLREEVKDLLKALNDAAEAGELDL